MDAWEIIKIIGTIITPIIVVFLSQLFSPIDVRSKMKKENLYDFFHNILLPITKFLRHKSAENIGINDIHELNRIYDKNYCFIPREMHIRFYEIKYYIMQNRSLSEKEYNRYARYINRFYSSVRKRLGYPNDYAFAFIISTPKKNSLIRFIPLDVLMALYTLFVILNSLFPICNFWILAVICIALSFIYIFVLHWFDTKYFNKKKAFVHKEETLHKNIIYPPYYANKKSTNCNRHHHTRRSITTSIRRTIHKNT